MSGNSWGRYPQTETNVRDVWWMDEFKAGAEPESDFGLFLPVGLGRSYGDSCLLEKEKGDLLAMPRCNRVLSLDCQSGLLEVEAGCCLRKLLAWLVERKFFIPVVPGTSFITVGGAIANDVHGKNHHSAGTFGNWVEEFDVWRSEKGWVTCSPEKNTKLYQATIGGLGLTGVIGRVKLRLESLLGKGLVEQDSRRFSSLEEGAEILTKMDRDFSMTVAWLDIGSKRKGRGVAMGGRFVDGEVSLAKEKNFGVPFRAPSNVLNSVTISGFNSLYSATRKNGLSKLSYSKYFFPLDGLRNWNLLYGKNGFVQYQFVVPLNAFSALEEVSGIISRAKQGAFLSVLKKFGGKKSPGWLSFPMEGWTLAMDFPMKGEETLSMLKRIDAVIRGAGGRLYPAKDARMEGEFFRESFPRWSELEAIRDPFIHSDFWERVTI